MTRNDTHTHESAGVYAWAHPVPSYFQSNSTLPEWQPAPAGSPTSRSDETKPRVKLDRVCRSFGQDRPFVVGGHEPWGFPRSASDPTSYLSHALPDKYANYAKDGRAASGRRPLIEAWCHRCTSETDCGRPDRPESGAKAHTPHFSASHFRGVYGDYGEYGTGPTPRPSKAESETDQTTGLIGRHLEGSSRRLVQSVGPGRRCGPRRGATRRLV
jgi:hypothetical protein